MKKILFPYDFSKASINAFRYAVHFAQTVGASITTLHVYSRPKSDNAAYYKLLTQNYNLGEWEGLDHFQATVPKLTAILEASQVSNLEILHLLEQGDPAEVISQVGKKEKMDYVIMGTIGATGLSEVFLGSVTEKVMNDAPCDVLAIPSGYKYSPIRRILFLTDFEDYRFRKLEHVLCFATLFKAGVDVLQVKQHIDPDDKEILRKWRGKFEEKNLEFHIHTGLVADEVVANFIEAAKISLVVITKHHKSLLRRVFLYSLSQQLAFHAKVPVLGLQAKS